MMIPNKILSRRHIERHALRLMAEHVSISDDDLDDLLDRGIFSVSDNGDGVVVQLHPDRLDGSAA